MSLPASALEAQARVRVSPPQLSFGNNGDGSESMGESSRSNLTRRATVAELAERQAAQLPTAADLYVHSLPGLPNLSSHPTHPLTLYAGYLPSYPGEGQGGGEGDTGKDSQIFFTLARARRSAGPQRLIFWFNGGPGCSSFDGFLMEVGPFRTVPRTKTESGAAELRLVEGWEEFANVVYVDQPPGVGYSFVPTNGYLHELDQASAHIMQFMHNFYSVFPDLAGVDTYIAGESFAGQYIPYFADAMLTSTKLSGVNLKGIVIGNGWIDPQTQYQGYADFAYEKGLIKKGTGEATRLDAVMERCQASLDQHTDPATMPINVDGCGPVMEAVMGPFEQEINGKKTCMNVYDVRLVGEWPACGMDWPPDLVEVNELLRTQNVINALHATLKETSWVECDGQVGYQLSLRESPASVRLLPGLLEKGVKVLIFAGDEDLICNYVGLEGMMKKLEWGGQTGWTNSTPADWYMNDTQAGTWREERGLSYARIFGGSHMVGFDLPEVTNDMIMRFMDVDLNLLPGQMASSTGRVGTLEKISVLAGGVAPAAGMPLLKGGAADWDSWYNAVSAFLILLILISIVALYFYFRRRGRLRRRGVSLDSTGRRRSRHREDDGEERVPLGGDRVELDDVERAEEYEYELDEEGRKRRRGGGRNGKGKGRSGDDWAGPNGNGRGYDEDEGRGGETVFSLGDEDEH